MPRSIRDLFERWNEKVERTNACWLWRGATKENGYGVIQRGRVGTRADNMRDMVEAGRWTQREPRRGQLNGNAKLTEVAVLEIRSRAESGTALARKFHVSRSQISNVRRRLGWQHVA